jgi:hypothetical protein
MFSTVLWNLLSPLAANDTDVVIKNAKTIRLVAAARLISRCERLVSILPQCMQPDISLGEDMFVIYPNRRNRIGPSAVQPLLSITSEKNKSNEKDKLTEVLEKLCLFTIYRTTQSREIFRVGNSTTTNGE